MANKNRKKEARGYVIPVPVVAVLLSAMMLLLAYIWLDVRSKALGARIKTLEQQQTELQKSYDLELWKWERMKSPSNIEKMLVQNNCVMVWPAENNIVRLQEETVLASAIADFNSKFAQMPAAKPIIHD